MDETTESTPGLLLTLSEEECWLLAGTVPVGRLAWTGPLGPTVVPVNFTLDGTNVTVRTAAYSALARECDDSPVAFEIDQIDPDTHSGWSVLMRGWAHIDFRDPGGTSPEVWASGTRALHVSVDVTQISGRKITPS
jgi:nitroimidazol reductase NimA-like FMN-containing flavoprotein (pyridoxamine 5'-phosphate oxidase superfamily)